MAHTVLLHHSCTRVGANAHHFCTTPVPWSPWLAHRDSCLLLGRPQQGKTKKTPPAPRRHLGLFVHLSFRFDTSELAVCCSSAASAEIAVCELPANWGGWVETEFSLYFCFQKSLLALGEAAGAAWFHVCLLVTVTCLQLLGARGRAGKALSLSLLHFFPPYYPLSRVLKTAPV